METLANLESFVRSAESGGFSAAARQLGWTPAAVSRNVAMLERNLGQRLFHRNTRRLTLTEAGELLLSTIKAPLGDVQAAIAGVSTQGGEPSGVLKLSVALTFGLDYVLPLLPLFLERYPHIRPDWHFENRPVDLIGEGFDAAIGGGFELAPGVVSRDLAPAHIIAVASPAYLLHKRRPKDPAGLAPFDGIVMRSERTGRVRQWMMVNSAGEQVPVALKETIVLNDPAAMCRAAQLGLGVALVAVPEALPHLESGALVRLLPQWYADLGSISLYYASRALLAPKTRAFVEFIVDEFRRRRLAKRLAGQAA